jgi:ATP-dependent Lon protease
VRARKSDYSDRETDYFEGNHAVRWKRKTGERRGRGSGPLGGCSEFENYVKLNKKVSPEVLGAVGQIDDYSKLADTIASHLAIKIPEKQDILGVASVVGAAGAVSA